MEIRLKPFQDHFLFSEKRFPAMVAAIGTGKTFMLLLKAWKYCETNPDSLWLIVRREYTDLRDSTIKDFQTYFGVTVDSNKEYHFPNGSVIMFRHGDELNVLKNINLSGASIEQAEEFDTEEIFMFLRDRLRRANGPYRQLCIIANAAGHNWVWRLWINNPSSNDYDVTQANTFDNADNLPDDFIADLRTMEKEAPSHYRRFVLNSHEETDTDDNVFSWESIQYSISQEMTPVGMQRRIMGEDVARYGADEIVYTLLESRGPVRWEQILIEGLMKKGIDETVGKTLAMQKEFEIDAVAVDDDGVGGGVTDLIQGNVFEVYPFNAQEASLNPKYANRRTEAMFKVRDWMDKGWLKIMNDQKLHEQLMTIRYTYNSKGQRVLISKEVLKRQGIKSPDRADALMIAVFFAESTLTIQRGEQYAVVSEGFDFQKHPYAITE